MMYICTSERRFRMAENNDRKAHKKSFLGYCSSLGYSITKLYDRSMASHVLKKARNGFLSLRTRAIGIFFFTFGVYSFVIAMLVNLFTSRNLDPSNIYGGMVCALSTFFLIFSKGNISTVLTSSALGEILCDYLNIDRDTVYREKSIGHLSIAFVLGVAAAALTVFVPLHTIIFFIFTTVVFAVILCNPETGLTALTVSLFITGHRFHYGIIAITAASYIFKFIRKKRYLTLKKTDLLAAIFTLSSVGGIFFTLHDRAVNGCIAYAALLIPYLLAILLLRDPKKITKMLTSAVITAGTISALAIIGEAVTIIAPAGTVADREYLLNLVSSLPAFESGFAAFGFSALIPVCTAFIIKPRTEGYRFTLILCLASMVTYLFAFEEMAFALAAIISTAVLLLITGSRWVYFSLAATLSVTVVAAFAGNFGERLFRYIYTQIYEAYHQAEHIYAFSDSPISSGYIICGGGFSESYMGKNFYYSIMSQLGIVGFIIFALLSVFIIGQAVLLIIKTYRFLESEKDPLLSESAKDRAETRMGIVSVVCSILCILITATFFDLYTNETAYLMLFLLFGICSAYTRSTLGHIEKTEQAIASKNSEEYAHAVIKRQHN